LDEASHFSKKFLGAAAIVPGILADRSFAHASFPSSFPMLSSTTPDVLHLTEYLDRFSNRRTHPTYSIPTEARFSVKRNAYAGGNLGPGEYKVCRDFPENHMHETPCTFSTKCVCPAPKYTFNVDERVAKDGCLKGISALYGKRNPLMGPGYYNDPPLESRVNKRVSRKCTIPKAKETQEAIRERKVLNLSPGPGTYTRKSKWDEMDAEQAPKIKRLAKKAAGPNWAAPQFAQIFACMKMSVPLGKSSSMPNLLGASQKVACTA